MPNDRQQTRPFEEECEAKLFEAARRNQGNAVSSYSALVGGACGSPVPSEVIQKWKRLLEGKPWRMTRGD
jgi:hypothetical protein